MVHILRFMGSFKRGVLIASFHLALLLLVLAVLLVTGEVATSGEALSHKWLPTCDLRTNLPRKGHLQVILDKVLGPELDITCFLDLMAEGRSLLGWAVGRTCNGWEKGNLYFTCGSH